MPKLPTYQMTTSWLIVASTRLSASAVLIMQQQSTEDKDLSFIRCRIDMNISFLSSFRRKIPKSFVILHLDSQGMNHLMSRQKWVPENVEERLPEVECMNNRNGGQVPADDTQGRLDFVQRLSSVHTTEKTLPSMLLQQFGGRRKQPQFDSLGSPSADIIFLGICRHRAPWRTPCTAPFKRRGVWDKVGRHPDLEVFLSKPQSSNLSKVSMKGRRQYLITIHV